MAGVLRWMLLQDGRPIRRGLTKQEAEKEAKLWAEGMEKHRAGSSIRLCAYDIAPDLEMKQRADDLYTEFQGYRNGWNTESQRRKEAAQWRSSQK